MSNLSSETEIELLDEESESSNTQEQNENVSLFEVVVGYGVATYARNVVGFFLFNSVVHGEFVNM